MERKRRKVNYALKLLSNLENLKKREIACDFQIRVNDKSFPVHRNVLIATSTYFEALFSSDMKEVSEGYIVMRGMTIDGIECCVEFIYTGEVQIMSSNVQSVLEASHLMQIVDLIEICLQYLRDNLSVQTSLLTMKLFRLYGTTEDQTTTDEYVNRHFKGIVQTDTFPLISKDDLVRYLKTSNLELEFHWQTIVTWMEQNIEEKEQFFTEAVANLLERGERTVSFIVGKVWRHPFVQTNDRAKDLVLKILSVQEDALNREVNLELCWSLKEIIKMHDFANSDRLNKILDEHISENFEEAIKKEEFYVFSFEALTAILTSVELYCQEESMKWEALLKWVKKRVESREKYLPDLMKLIAFEKISVEYIQQNIRSEALFKKSGKCKDVLLDAMCAPASLVKADQPSTLVMLGGSERSGLLTALDMENGHHTEITRVEKKGLLKITSVKGELYLLQNEDVYKYSDTGSWEKRQSLKNRPFQNSHVLTFRKKIYMISHRNFSCYSPSQNVWTEGIQGCGLGNVLGVAASQDFIYALGIVGQIRRFSPSSKTWFEMGDNRWHWTSSSAAVAYRDKLYVMGGFLDGNILRDVYSYDPSKNMWGPVENMNTPRSHFSAVVYNDRLYVVGGDRNETGGRLRKYSIEEFDQVLNKWRIVQEMPRCGHNISTCVVKSVPAQD